MKMLSVLKRSGNEICYMISSILLVKMMLCSKLRCQKGSVFSYKIRALQFASPHVFLRLRVPSNEPAVD